jgi:imidazole glycerol-phosphate synthase subunit HisF
MKIRIIPTILTDGITVVKGENFNNWRTVGNAFAVAKLFGDRQVDELLLLDVKARERNQIVSEDLMHKFSENLNIPFSVGGGINTIGDAKKCFRAGAEKIVIGAAAIENPNLVSEIAETFGNQAVIVALDFLNVFGNEIVINSGKKKVEIDLFKFIPGLVDLGVGEILIQSVEREGTMSGPDLRKVEFVSSLTSLPIIASGGISSGQDVQNAINSGASAVSIGALFQFTRTTPRDIHDYLLTTGFNVRKI